MRVLMAIAVWTLVEIALFVVIGGWIGVFWSWAVVVGTAALGIGLIRGQGGRAIRGLRRDLGAAHRVAAPMGHSALIVVAAILLIMPGFLTDGIGLILLVPWIRGLILAKIATRTRIYATQRDVSGMFHPNRSEILDIQAKDVTAPANQPQKPSGWTKP